MTIVRVLMILTGKNRSGLEEETGKTICGDTRMVG